MSVLTSPNFVKCKFEDFQKSEMISKEVIENNCIYRLIFTKVGGNALILKEEFEPIK